MFLVSLGFQYAVISIKRLAAAPALHSPVRGGPSVLGSGQSGHITEFGGAEKTVTGGKPRSNQISLIDSSSFRSFRRFHRFLI